jgi:uncharacterized membrane protein YcfT
VSRGATPAGRLDWVDAGRGIAIVLVALYHSASWLIGAGFPLELWRQINEAVSSLRMPLFFVLAGLFAGKWLVASWGDLWRSKLWLFVWVFVLWEIIGSVAFQLSLVMDGEDLAIPATIRQLLVSPFAPRFELWFIWALALFFVVAKLIRSVDWRVQLAVTGLASVVALSGWETANIGWSGSIKYFFFFLAGIYLKDRILSLGRARISAPLVGVVVAWAALSTAIAVFSLRSVPGLYFVDCVLGVVAGITLARPLARIPRLVMIGSTTLPIYLTHTPLIIVIAYALSLLARVVPFGLVVWVLPPIVAAVAIAASLVLSARAARGPLRLLYAPPTRARSRVS